MDFPPFAWRLTKWGFANGRPSCYPATQPPGHHAPDPFGRRQAVRRLRRRHRSGDRRPADWRGSSGADLRCRHGASNFTYVERPGRRGLPTGSVHTRIPGGVPRLIVPDNAKVAIIKACFYEPQVNRTYSAMAADYGTAPCSSVTAPPPARLSEISPTAVTRNPSSMRALAVNHR